MRAFPYLLGIGTCYLATPGKRKCPVNGGFNDRLRILFAKIIDKLPSRLCVFRDEKQRIQSRPTERTSNAAAGRHHYEIMSCGLKAVMQADEQSQSRAINELHLIHLDQAIVLFDLFPNARVTCNDVFVHPPRQLEAELLKAITSEHTGRSGIRTAPGVQMPPLASDGATEFGQIAAVPAAKTTRLLNQAIEPFGPALAHPFGGSFDSAS